MGCCCCKAEVKKEIEEDRNSQSCHFLNVYEKSEPIDIILKKVCKT